MDCITLYIEKNYSISNSNVIEQIIYNENYYHPIRNLLNLPVSDGTFRLEDTRRFIDMAKGDLYLAKCSTQQKGALTGSSKRPREDSNLRPHA